MIMLTSTSTESSSSQLGQSTIKFGGFFCCFNNRGQYRSLRSKNNNNNNDNTNLSLIHI